MQILHKKKRAETHFFNPNCVTDSELMCSMAPATFSSKRGSLTTHRLLHSTGYE